ncbi:MAG: LigA [Elusimicrobia bacterium]|nr:MAG: LigA [Elusimicrobiota bacterium]
MERQRRGVARLAGPRARGLRGRHAPRSGAGPGRLQGPRGRGGVAFRRVAQALGHPDAGRARAGPPPLRRAHEPPGPPRRPVAREVPVRPRLRLPGRHPRPPLSRARGDPGHRARQALQGRPFQQRGQLQRLPREARGPAGRPGRAPGLFGKHRSRGDRLAPAQPQGPDRQAYGAGRPRRGAHGRAFGAQVPQQPGPRRRDRLLGQRAPDPADGRGQGRREDARRAQALRAARPAPRPGRQAGAPGRERQRQEHPP